MDNSQVLRLLGRIEQADEGAFRELYCAFSRKLYAYVLRQLSDSAQAEEIVADTLYEVWKAPAKFRGESQFSTWLIGIARNKVLMHWRGRKPDADHDDVADMAEQLASDAPGAFEQMAQSQRSDGVRQLRRQAARPISVNVCTWCSTRAWRWPRWPASSRSPRAP